MPDFRTARAVLFVPGTRPDRFDKAVASGADVVVLDLEDAVGPEDKDGAREGVVRWLRDGGRGAVRVNGVGTPWHADDLAAVGELGVPVMVPKAEDPDELAATADRLRPGTDLVPLVETAAGILAAREVCRVPGVVRPAFGSVDLATQLGVDHTDPGALHHARAALVLAAHAAGVGAPVDGVTTAVRDEEALRGDCARALALGLTAKLCVHPDQVPVVAGAFRPTEEQRAWARRVVEAAGSGAVAVLDGALVDKPVVDRARSLLARAGD